MTYVDFKKTEKPLQSFYEFNQSVVSERRLMRKYESKLLQMGGSGSTISLWTV